MNKLMNKVNEDKSTTYRQIKLEIDISESIQNIVKDNPGFAIERVDTHYDIKSCKFYVYYTLVKFNS